MSFDYMSRAKQLREEIIANRRAIHRYAEIGFELEKTVAFVMEQLSSYGYQPRRVGKAGVTCTAGKGGKVFLLRGDMDAHGRGNRLALCRQKRTLPLLRTRLPHRHAFGGG